MSKPEENCEFCGEPHDDCECCPECGSEVACEWCPGCNNWSCECTCDERKGA